MNLKELISELKNKYRVLDEKFNDPNHAFVSIVPDQLHAALGELKSYGWKHLSTISCVDWIDDNEFELVYHLWNWDSRSQISLKTRISRSNPHFPTIMHIFPTAKYYERDIHEFFGVEFDGNSEMESLFLEFWDDIPPMRKEFDPLKYSREKFGERDYKVPFADFIVEEGDQK